MPWQVRERSNIISLIFAPSPPRNHSIITFRSPPPSIIILYRSCCTVFWHVFNAFYCIFSTFLHKSSKFGVITNYAPPPPISFNSHSRSQPPSPPLLLRDMIFERSLNLQISWSKLQAKGYSVLVCALFVAAYTGGCTS